MYRHLTVPTALIGTLLALSACGSKDASTPPALTKAEAAQVLARYQTVNNQANATLNAGLLAGVETGAQLDMDRADYKQRQALKEKLAPFSFNAPVFYIPRQTGYPRWFAVSATAGRMRHALVFTRQQPNGPWLLAADPHAQAAGIELDKQGYATAVSAGDVAATHAAVLNDGPRAGAAGAAGMAAGLYTTQAHQALLSAQAILSRRGVRFSFRFTTDPRQAFALRTPGGGALVWYVLRQDERYDVSKTGRGASGVAGALAKAVKHNLRTTVLIQYLAVIPPHGAPQVVGSYRRPVQSVTG